MICQLGHLLESIISEDEADQGGKSFFSEVGESLNQVAGISVEDFF